MVKYYEVPEKRLGVNHVNLDAGIKEDIIALAKYYNLSKVLLFGSRARGDNRNRSDVDLAVSGGDIVGFRTSIDDEIRTLLMFDVVNLDEPVQEELSEAIRREGQILYEKLENFNRALDNLKLCKEYAAPYDVVTETGLVNLFSICFEQSWKVMKELLEKHGYSESKTGSPKMIIKLAYSAGMIQDEAGWIELLDRRNEVSHSYNEEVAVRIIESTKEKYLLLFENLLQELETNWS